MEAPLLGQHIENFGNLFSVEKRVWLLRIDEDDVIVRVNPPARIGIVEPNLGLSIGHGKCSTPSEIPSAYGLTLMSSNRNATLRNPFKPLAAGE